MEKKIIILLCLFIATSCKYDKPPFRYSNFYNTPVENVAKAIKNDDAKSISREILNRNVNINFLDAKYEVSLLALAIYNHKKVAFEELLDLGANPNISNSYCVSPLITAIRYNNNCDLYFIEKLLENNANITPRFWKKCNYAFDPIQEVLLQYNDENKIKCGLKILKLLTTQLDNPNLLFLYNNSEDYHENIVYNCLNSNKNLMALKFLIVDLKYKVPEKIYIDGTVLLNNNGYKSLEEILNSREFTFNESNKFRENAKNEILTYLKKNG
jgi:ankyrin repeat protein